MMVDGGVSIKKAFVREIDRDIVFKKVLESVCCTITEKTQTYTIKYQFIKAWGQPILITTCRR